MTHGRSSCRRVSGAAALLAGALSVLALATLASGCQDRPTAPSVPTVPPTDSGPTTPIDSGVARPWVDSAARVITAQSIAADVSVLADDSMRGRATPSPELTASANYIEAAFRKAGLGPGGDSSGYKQTYRCARGPDPANVIAVLRGSDAARANEWVVVSAHYDHIGIGPPNTQGDSIDNGADDNASGTAGLLGIARAFAALDTVPPRSVAFVAVSGEELGFVGSYYFVEHRPSAMARIVADINLDMVGRNAPDLLYANGLSLSSLGSSIRREAQRHPDGLTIHSEPRLPSTYIASDQIAFAMWGIPAIHLYTGDHPDVHRPSDELSRLDTDKAARVARLAFRLAYAVASDPAPPSWTSVGDSTMRLLNPHRGDCNYLR